MTEQEWLACTSPQPMLEFLAGKRKASRRKLWLFACACCRLVWPRLPDLCHRLVEAVERYADGRASARELQALFRGYSPAQVGPVTVPGAGQAERAARQLGNHWGGGATAAEWDSLEVARSAAESLAKTMPWWTARRLEAQLLHDILGPLPFRPVALDPAWLTWGGGTARRLAQAIYDDRGYDGVPVLADALEDAGCDQPDLLGHLRGPGRTSGGAGR